MTSKQFFHRLTFFFLGFLSILEAGAASVEYRYYRFDLTRTRSFNSNSVQLAEFDFFSATGVRTEVPIVTNPGGNNPGGEGPMNVTDGDVGTKWLDFSKESLVFDFGQAVEVDHYGFTTANDAASRDPVRWRFDGSQDGVTWTTLDDRTAFSQDISTDRFVAYEFTLNQVAETPDVDLAATGSGATSELAVNIAGGESALLEWSSTDASSAVLTGGGSTLSTSLSGNVSVSPSLTTTYTFEATNAAGSTSATVTVYVDETVIPARLNEFLAIADESPLLDEDGEPSDWIEIHNANPFAITLDGYALTDDPLQAAPWAFPSGVQLGPDDYLVLFASGKNRAVPGAELHTDFSLAREGDYLALLSGGAVVEAFDPTYPEMFEDVSYGRVPVASGGGYNYFISPTPGAVNDTVPGPPGADVIFVTLPGTFTSSVAVELATDSTGAEIRYTTNGQVPDASSSLYTGPITLTASTVIKAGTFETGRAPGAVATGAFLQVTSGLAAQTSDLPIVVIENFGGGAVPSGRDLQEAYFNLFEPDEVTGRTSVTSAPTVTNRTGIKRRGSSTISDPKGSYRLEFWQDDSEEDKNVNLLGMSTHDEWVLYAPYVFDRALMRNAFLFGLSRDAGDYAPRTRFCEVYLNTDGGAMDYADYQGVYVLMERITRDNRRVDVEKLEPSDNLPPEVTGGYILGIDRLDPEDQGFRSALGHPEDPVTAGPQPFYVHVYPKEQNITPAQSAYIRGYIDDLEAALYGPGFADKQTGYRAWFDIKPTVDYHIFSVFSKDPDALRLSTYLHKPRNGKLAFGPLWDFDRAMGCDNDGRSADPAGWQPPNETAQYFEYDYWGRLFEDPDFFQDWVDRWQDLRRTVFSDASMTARIDGMAAQVAESEPRDTARWPEAAPNGGPLSSLGGFAGEVDHLKNWVTQRAAWIDSQFPSPPIVPAGGQVLAGTVIGLTPTDGTLYYTTDGSDPRLPGGGINPDALAIGSGGTINEVLVDEAATAVEVFRPSGASPGPTAWTDLSFDASTWLDGIFGVGYENSDGYQNLINTSIHSGAGGPTSIYIRAPFNTTLDGSEVTSLTLRLRYDDGFVAYLNGTRIASDNAPASPAWNQSATASHADGAAVNFVDFDVSSFANLLVPGDNLLAIHALNDGGENASNTGSSSSDMLMSAELVATYQSGTSGDELTINETTTVSARSYNGFSWSGPVNSTYVIGVPASASNLVVSELMYHPTNPTPEEELAGFTDDGNFEYLELQNISTDTIDLAGVVISDCFDFDFTNSPITLLGPGEVVLVVRNADAAGLRYGSGLPIAGAWGDPSSPDGGSNLSNGGERVIITAADLSVIRDFTYDDVEPWPLAPDGDGPSLMLASPFALPNHGEGTSWVASAADGGTPGVGLTVYDSWALSRFSGEDLLDPAIAGPQADPDGDGIINELELVYGGNPLEASPGLAPAGAFQSFDTGSGPQQHFVVTFTRDPSVIGYESYAEFGSDLVSWPHRGILVNTIANPDGTETVTYRDPLPASSSRRFGRVKAESAL